MKKYVLSVMTLFLLGACNSKDTEIIVEPAEKEDVPSRVRGVMIDGNRFDDVSAQTIAQWGGNLVRMPIFPVSYANKKNANVWDMLPSYLKEVEVRVLRAEANGLKVVLDLHEAPIHNPGDISSVDFWTKPEIKQNFIRFWKAVAEHFKDKRFDAIIWGYDIYNEPVEKKPNTAHIPYTWREIAPNIIAEIRKIDKNVWIVYEPGPWGDPLGFENLTPLEDRRVIYSIHYYSPGMFTHQGVSGFYGANTKEEAKKLIGKEYPADYPEVYWDNVEKKNKYRPTHWNKEKHKEILQPVIDFQKKYNVPIYVGEFSVIRWAPTDSAKRWLIDVIDLFEQNNWSWSYHAFREFHGWDLEFKEGTSEFWFKGDPHPQKSPIETQRAQVVKAGLQKNKR